ncbi:MAG: ABC-F family ATP-binding cassette domain-containing protein [Tannerella sp.]|jgi:ATP-binding cassette subfamily F protein 3|nr:ABC-F family ATP-binding cassette domain-containing protein [Tannerella sp.]
MISIEGLTVEFGGFTLLDNISFVVNKKDRIALVGKNGAGKSTLMKIIAGMQTPTNGVVSVPKDTSIGYLPQQMQLSDTRTVMEETEQAFEYIHDTEQEINSLNTELSERTDYDTDAFRTLIDRVTLLTERFQMIGGTNYHAELERTLLGLGFIRSDFDRLTSEFSGGWRMRIELAKLLLKRPDVMLLDEPTNHLDIESIQWLENFIATQANAVILVSHDRAFINNTTRRTLEIELGHIYDYKVKYNEYVVLRKERREQQTRAYENQQKMLADTEAFIERFRYKASKAIQVQSRIKQLEKIERIEIDEEDNTLLRLKFPPAPRSGSYPLIIENLAKRYGDHLVFAEATFTINRGDKIAFVGKNGEGKSTLVKCIMNEITDCEGTLKTGHNVKIGYFAQNQAQLLDENKTVFETVDYVAQGDIRTKIRDILGAFMFGGEASDKKVKVLSGGEKSRLSMIRLLLEPVNLLILDEPTNHLDMRSKDVLKSALLDFDGTVIVVSHDREFLDGLVGKVYEFGNQRIREHLGGIYDFLEYKKIENLRELERKTAAGSAKNNSKNRIFENEGNDHRRETIYEHNDEKPGDEPDSHGNKTTNSDEPDSHGNKTAHGEAAGQAAGILTAARPSYEEQKEQMRLVRKLEKTVAQTEQQITETETKIALLEARMATAEGSADASLYTEYEKSKKELSAALDKWEEATGALETKMSQTKSNHARREDE